MSILKYPTVEEGEARLELYYRNADIWTATCDGKYDRVKELLDNGENIDVKNSHGRTSLILASYYCYIDIVKLLLDNGADVDARDNYGRTAIIYASRYGYTDIVKLLLDKDADVNVKSNSGYTALMWASASHDKIRKMLLDAGADMHVENRR